MAKHHCEDCRVRRCAERKPDGLIARLWRWHAGWCPSWKAYQKSLAEGNSAVPDADLKLPPPTGR